MSDGLIRVCPAMRDEAEALAAISAAEHDSWSADQFISTIEDPLARVWSARGNDDRTVGYAAVYYDSGGSELAQIAVDPDCRRQGIATALLDAALAFLREEGVPQIMLEVRSRNDGAIPFYRRNGFEQAVVVRDFYRDPQDDALRMTRDVDR